MNEIDELQQKLQDTTAAIARMERLIADSPDMPSLAANMRSLQKRHKNLERDFRAAADALGVDVCSYRLFVDDSRPTLPAVVSALGDFQNLFSLVYGARLEGPKATAHLREEIINESTFGFAYTYTGSLGVVLTLPNDRLLFEEIGTRLDETMGSIFKMAKAETSEQLQGFARELGVAPIRALYRWASDHAKAELGANIEWQRLDRVRASVLVQPPEMERLRRAIEVTSDRHETPEIEMTGDLIGADIAAHTFHMKIGTADVRGRFGDAIGANHTVVLPRTYKAIMRVTKWVRYATEKEDVEHFLLRLEELPEAPEPPESLSPPY
jgi:hypothetical protein